MADRYTLTSFGLDELGETTGSVAGADLLIVVDPTSYEPRLETVTNVLAA